MDFVLFGLVRQAEKPKQVLKVRQKFVVLLMTTLGAGHNNFTKNIVKIWSS